jgi:hypothetical protein
MVAFALFAVVESTRPMRATYSAWIAEKYLLTNLINNENYERND